LRICSRSSTLNLTE